jgi:hypothetical protein
MSRPVPCLAKRVENVRSFFRNDALIREVAKRFFKGLAFAKIERVMGGNRLTQKLGKLAQFEDRRAGIVAKVSPASAPSCTSWASWTLRKPKLLVDSIVPPPQDSIFIGDLEVACTRRRTGLPPIRHGAGVPGHRRTVRALHVLAQSRRCRSRSRGLPASFPGLPVSFPGLPALTSNA